MADADVVNPESGDALLPPPDDRFYQKSVDECVVGAVSEYSLRLKALQSDMLTTMNVDLLQNFHEPCENFDFTSYIQASHLSQASSIASWSAQNTRYPPCPSFEALDNAGVLVFMKAKMLALSTEGLPGDSLWNYHLKAATLTDAGALDMLFEAFIRAFRALWKQRDFKILVRCL